MTHKRRALLALPLLIVAAVGGLAAFARPVEPHPWFRPNDPAVLVIAHQGGNHLRPDQTLPAFAHAVELGADVLEMDLNMTADGVLVVIHDRTVDRTTDGSGAVRDLTLAEIKALDAAHTWTPRTPDGTPIDPDDFPYRGQGLTIPTFEEVLTAFPDHRILVEMKQEEPSTAEPLCELIRAQGRQNDVMVASSISPELNAFRRACPEVATSGHYGDVLTFFILQNLRLGALYTPQEVAYQVPREFEGLRVITPRFVEVAQRRGVEVHPWTINTEAEMRRLIAMGVDGIITDQPGLLLEVLGR